MNKATSEPLFEQRPWGSFEIVSRFAVGGEGQEVKVKKILVTPGKRLSYQSHQKREETWYIASGEAEVTLDGNIKELISGDTMYIPLKAKHRIANSSSSTELIFIEIAKGICDESDIVRYEDDFGREMKVNYVPQN